MLLLLTNPQSVFVCIGCESRYNFSKTGPGPCIQCHQWNTHIGIERFYIVFCLAEVGVAEATTVPLRIEEGVWLRLNGWLKGDAAVDRRRDGVDDKGIGSHFFRMH